ncbi:bifunctional adenosylcobinamide kinase/adenosylcobinamide-phosphate guanylyltransferase [Cyanobacterium stanieri LEGE 03274]|uniref:Adenosylcobinamide kinase n=1 Tax=Cyanobacterium stanieri LEGE 03274 TaxID=1828756 RepID=A0ABR9V4S6_9CHRO|nr:bifunctional adenosylcobinamide kinase/adenosylcobinamide-phosphate guanylyltransferase [Cyanobacterium stanieri]MBE9222847.1 bifunctional adenosylcobinamide kinase/adenosylcobinamide-phosphate guanylyltransferase [Cyanobacterium stanieri LEGE 03274]
MAKIILVTGGASSGKSEWAESLAKNQDQKVIYIATAQQIPSDQEWTQKIKIHQQRRPKSWQCLEVPFQLSNAIDKCDNHNLILIDSLGTWVANFIEKDETFWQQQVEQLLDILANSNNQIIFVAEETGWGIIPAYELGRLFRNRLGSLTREIGQLADEVFLVIGGYAVDISKIGVSLDSKP